LLAKEGIKANQLHFVDLFPLPKERVLEILRSCKRLVSVEGNYSSQMARLVLAETGFEIQESVNRYDGEPFTGEYIRETILKLPNLKKEELTHV